MACLPAGRYTRMSYYVYVLRSLKSGYFYKGITDNLERRLERHNSGLSRTTKSQRPWRLIHVELCDDRKEARKLEKFFKSGFGREIIAEIAEVVEW